jgi:hypothetical protein
MGNQVIKYQVLVLLVEIIHILENSQVIIIINIIIVREMGIIIDPSPDPNHMVPNTLIVRILVNTVKLLEIISCSRCSKNKVINHSKIGYNKLILARKITIQPNKKLVPLQIRMKGKKGKLDL